MKAFLTSILTLNLLTAYADDSLRKITIINTNNDASFLFNSHTGVAGAASNIS